ncbi:MAG TPA: hypothetical protein VH164_04910, partial [Ktedonobacteraceae bacterium]|nr:hypothetical protein [Ktedonobacteraceae bacterium]
NHAHSDDTPASNPDDTPASNRNRNHGAHPSSDSTGWGSTLNFNAPVIMIFFLPVIRHLV